MKADKVQSALDPVLVEVIRYGLQAILDEIEADLTRTAYSPLVYEYKDYCVALLDIDGRIISQSRGGMPIFLADLGAPVVEAIRVYTTEGIHPGDVFLVNEPRVGGQHLNNVVTLTPAFAGERLIGFVGVRTHWVDLGGRDVGSSSTSATTDIYQEGVQYPLVKLYKRGVLVDDLMRIVLANTRFPQMVEGDLNAQLAGCMKGRRLLEGLLERYGDTTIMAAVKIIWGQSERKAREAVRAIPDGIYEAESFIDDDGTTSGERVRIRVKVIISGEEMTVDLSGLNPQVRGSINAGRIGGGFTAAKLAFKYLTTPLEAVDEGGFNNLNIILPEGTFLSASPPAAMARFYAGIPTVIDTIIKSVASAIPERVAAAHHASYGVYVFYGLHPETGQLFKNMDTAPGGWGAHARGDGFSPLKTMAHGDTRDIPIEVQETFYPVRIERYGYVPDSGGAGKYRGGLATEKVYTVLHPCFFTANTDRTDCAPWGLFGGADGSVGSIEILYPGRTDYENVKKVTGIELPVETEVRIKSGGGGGFGRPEERDPKRVMSDVRNGYITFEHAENIYKTIPSELTAHNQVPEGSNP